MRNVGESGGVKATNGEGKGNRVSVEPSEGGVPLQIRRENLGRHVGTNELHRKVVDMALDPTDRRGETLR